MLVRFLRRAALPGGRLFPPGSAADLDDHEARLMVGSGVAELVPTAPDGDGGGIAFLFQGRRLASFDIETSSFGCRSISVAGRLSPAGDARPEPAAQPEGRRFDLSD